MSVMNVSVVELNFTGRLGISLLFVVNLMLAGCAGTTPPPDSTAGIRPTGPYPVLTDSADRRQESNSEWNQLFTGAGREAPEPVILQPVTATVRSIPAGVSTVPVLPEVGSPVLTTEEEIRESLRRFIVANPGLIGAEARHLALLTRTTRADGSILARYHQDSFRYPLKGGYGDVEITFNQRREILQISSTCIPETRELRQSIAALTPHLKVDDLLEKLAGKTVSSGNSVVVFGPSQSIKVGDLVILPTPTTSASGQGLMLRLALEIHPTGDLTQTLYVDPDTGGILGTE